MMRALFACCLLASAAGACSAGSDDAPAARSRGFDLEATADEGASVSDAAPLPSVAPVVPPPPARFVPALPAELAEGAGIIDNYAWALALGKALFWDQQVGSDGQACASCHFNAGADGRVRNQINPGFQDSTGAVGGDTSFGSLRSDTGGVAAGQMPGGSLAKPNASVAPEDFPFHRLADISARDSAVITDTNDVMGSAGAFAAEFVGVDAHGDEYCTPAEADIFHVTLDGRTFAGRQVEPRNTPTTINAAFNVRQFWDGRANNLFNGVGVFGLRDVEGDPNLRLIVLGESGLPELSHLELENASLASQAVGPPLSAIEMSCRGRSFADLGRKILRSAPLARQRVSPDDSVLGALARADGPGLLPEYAYSALIQAAFSPKYWSAPGTYSRQDGALVEDEHGYTQMETNMSMFWGISIMLYEATLVSDTSEFDDLVASGDITFPGCTTTDAVDPLLARGCKIFFRFPFGAPPADGVRGAGCSACHAGTDLFSEAAVQAGAAFAPLLQVPDVNNQVDTRDLGFANIGTRPAFVDVFLGGTDPYGNPLSFGRQYRQFLDTGDISVVKDPFLARAIAAGQLVRGGAVNATAKLESDGATKVPTLRNVALTPPYFSYGGYANLRQVVEFYNRGGNRRQITAANAALEAHGSACTSGDDTGSGPDGNQRYPVAGPDCGTNVSGLMVPLGLVDCNASTDPACDPENDDVAALVRFMLALTDRRVQCDQAPFDHPELPLSVGHLPEPGALENAAADAEFHLPAVGAGGFTPPSGLCIPNAGDLFGAGMRGRIGGERVAL
jgi:cytochrome c peroxidase